MAVNPFVWTQPLEDPAKIVGMDAFSREVAMILKGKTNVAIFGPRDTGKTSFTAQLAGELGRDHGAGAPPHTVVRINLQRAFSVPAFNACVHDALLGHPSRRIQREARKQLAVLEKEIGFDIKVIKGAVRRTGVTPAQDVEALHAQLATIPKLGDDVVVVFDEFQRLNRCPEEPLSIIRSALMSSGASNVSLLLTGSIREALQMMLDRSHEPIFGEAHQMQLPEIGHVEFLEYLDYSFEATGKPADEQALNHLLNLTRCHPKRTQQLAWAAWRLARPANAPLGAEIVEAAHEEMLSGTEAGEFAATLDTLGSGGDPETNEERALFLLAERGGGSPTSREHVGLYGFTNHTMIIPAFERLRRRGLIDRRRGEWTIVDPLFATWLRRTSPFGSTPAPERPIRR
ncbi:MAG: ATP-binding protein [Actinomycetota bacterium]|nr:ATP-binding protein [Actinomycetota bacterium]